MNDSHEKYMKVLIATSPADVRRAMPTCPNPALNQTGTGLGIVRESAGEPLGVMTYEKYLLKARHGTPLD